MIGTERCHPTSLIIIDLACKDVNEVAHVALQRFFEKKGAQSSFYVLIVLGSDLCRCLLVRFDKDAENLAQGAAKLAS